MSVALPTFRQLLAQLGYGDLGQCQTTIFVHDALVFLKAINPTNCIYFPSYDSKLEVYHGLARHFLNVLGRGSIYWPGTGDTGLVYPADHQKIQTLVGYLFFRFATEVRRWRRTASSRSRDAAMSETFRLESLLTNCNADGIIQQGIIIDYMTNARHIGSFQFRYSIGEELNGYMCYRTWEPPHKFKVTTLLELMSELPGAGDASGVRISFTGPGFCIRGVTFDESDFKRLKVELNDQVCRLLINRRSVWDNFNVHVQIMILREGQPASHWIFSE